MEAKVSVAFSAQQITCLTGGCHCSSVLKRLSWYSCNQWEVKYYLGVITGVPIRLGKEGGPFAGSMSKVVNDQRAGFDDHLNLMSQLCVYLFITDYKSQTKAKKSDST